MRGTFRLPVEDAEVMLTVLEPLARPDDSQDGVRDDRSVGQRRADALVEVFAGAAAWMDLPTAGGQRPQVSYVLSAAWCAGEQPPSLTATLTRPDLPPWARSAALGADGIVHASVLQEHCGAAAWTGPHTRARVEAVLCDARISRVLLDSRGQVLSLTSLTDQITLAQRRAVSARDRHCVARGCHRPPTFCDVHHLLARADGGSTQVGNLVLLRLRHHTAWHRGRLQLHQLHTPWLDQLQQDDDDPWDGHAPPLIA